MPTRTATQAESDPTTSRFARVGIGYHDNDPSAGSPTETLLRLLLPLDDKVRSTSRNQAPETGTSITIQSSHRTIQSVAATGGVYKGQGRNQGGLLNHPY